MEDAMKTDSTLEVYPSPDGRHGRIWSLSWSPRPCNGADHMLASCGDNAIVWQFRNSVWSRFTQLNTGSRVSLRACAWRLDGVILAAGGSDSKITLWEYKQAAGSFERIIEVPVPQGEIIKSLSWNEKGFLLSCTNNACISIIGLNKIGNYHVKCRIAVPEIAEASCAEWHPDGIKFALAGYNGVKVFRVQIRSDEDINANGIYEIASSRTHKGGNNCISFWIDGSVIVSAGSDGMLRFLVFEQKSSTAGSSDDNVLLGLIGWLPEHQGVLCCDWSRCHEESIGYLIASGSYNNSAIVISSQCPPLEDRSVPQYLRVIQMTDAYNGPITSIKWSPTDPRLLACTGLDGVIKLWKVKGSVPYHRPSVPQGRRRLMLDEQQDTTRLTRPRRYCFLPVARAPYFFTV